jgi:phospholipase/carboxylesterase
MALKDSQKARKDSRKARRRLFGPMAMGLSVAGALVAPAAGAAKGPTYLVHTPQEARPRPPLIVLLHGSGADERDMIGLWRDLPGAFVVVSPRAPFSDGGGYRWYRKTGATPRAGDIEASRALVDTVVADALTRFDIDPERVFIAGFSQGAVMVYEIALREPDRFRGAAVLSGSLLAATTAGLSARSGSRGPSFFIGHGTADPRIPVGAARAATAALGRLGVPNSLHLYAGMGHAIDAAETQDLDAWLAREADDAGGASK